MVNFSVTLSHYKDEPSFGSVEINGPGKYWIPLRQAKSDSRSVFKRTLGVHVFSSQIGDWIYGILRFSNGLVNKDGTGFIGTVYSNHLSVRIDGSYVTLVLPDSDSTRIGGSSIPMVFRPRSVWEVPFYFSLKGETRVPIEILKAINCEVIPIVSAGGYGPTNSKQPSVDSRANSSKYADINTSLDNVSKGILGVYDNSYGNIAHQYKVIGPFLVEGYPNGYAHGGYGIDSCHGWEGCPEGVGYHARLHRANMARQFCDALDENTGDPIKLYEWTKAPGRDLMKGQPGRESEVELLCFLEGTYETRKYPVFNRPDEPIPYEGAIWEYRPNDVAHIIRVIRHSIPLIEYGGRNPMALCARMDLEMIAEDSRYQTWSDRSDELATPSYPGEWLPQTLARVLKDPGGHGHPRLERNFAWMAYLGACMLKYSYNNRTWQTWSNNMLMAWDLHKDKFGYPHRDNLSPVGKPNDYGTQIFHMALVGISIFSLKVQNGSASTRWPSDVENMARSMYFSHDPIKYSYNDYGPGHWCQTASQSGDLDTMVWIGDGDPAHVLTLMALMARGPNKSSWVDRSLKYQIQHNSIQERKLWLQSAVEKSWTAEMQSVVESLR